MSADKRLKVLYLSAWYPHKYDSMSGLFVEKHADAISLYCSLAVLYVHADEHDRTSNYNFESEQKENNYTLRVYYKKVKTRVPLISQFIKLYRYFSSYYLGYEVIKKEFGSFDIIHANIFTRTAFVAYIISRIEKKPYIVTEHWTRYLKIHDTFMGLFRKRLTKLVVKKAAAVLPVTANLKDAMLSHNLQNKNYIVINNVVDVNEFFPVPGKSSRVRKVIIHLSCFLDHHKNVSGIIRVIKKVSEKRNDFELHLVGDGPDMEMLQNYASEVGLKDTVIIFEGLKTGNDLVKSLNNADFMLMFSNFENIPVVINESFSCGLPVLSSDVGGIAEHVTKDFGLLVNAGDEDNLFEKINYMLDHFGEYNSEMIRKHAIENYSYEKVGKRITEIYEMAISQSL